MTSMQGLKLIKLLAKQTVDAFLIVVLGSA
jgi:hypothetical protein